MTRARAQQEISAGGVVYRMERGVPLYLLIRDSYHNWGFPKGHLEQGERWFRVRVREHQLAKVTARPCIAPFARSAIQRTILPTLRL